MKFFTYLLITLSMCFGSNLFSDSTVPVKYFWTEDAMDFFFNIEISKQLEFDQFNLIRHNRRSSFCEVKCKPKTGQIIRSWRGEPIDEVVIELILIGFIDNEVQYRVSVTEVVLNPFAPPRNRKIRRTVVMDQGILHKTLALHREPVFFPTDNEQIGNIAFPKS
jgi:hypothetical protein